VYIADYQGDTIDEYSPSGAFLGVFAANNLDHPLGIAFTAVSVPEPTSALLLLAGIAVLPCALARRVRCGTVNGSTS
jgi:hypothetical protein